MNLRGMFEEVQKNPKRLAAVMSEFLSSLDNAIQSIPRINADRFLDYDYVKTQLMANTKGEGKSNDPFWDKAETLLYCALIGYIHYEAPVEEQNFATLIEFINAMEVREDDEDFQNPVDIMFENLKKKKPNHFAVRQFAKFKLAAGVINYKRFLIQSYERQPMAA